MRKSLTSYSVLATLTVLLAGCSVAGESDGDSSDRVRSLSTQEALDDFDEIAASFRGLYGAMERKEARYHFSFENVVREFRAKITLAQTEGEVRGLYLEFVSKFQDPHVSLSGGIPSDSMRGFSLPLYVMPVDDTFVIYNVDDAIGDSLKRGDELLSMDGKPAKDLVNSWEKFGSIANKRASMHIAANRLTGRSSFLSASIDPNRPVTLHVRGVDGHERDVVLSWKETAHVLPPTAVVPQAGTSTRENAMMISDAALDVTRSELMAFGERVPYFMTPEARATLNGAQEVTPSPASLTKFSLTDAQAQAINYFAMTYTLEGKKVLFVRLPDYTPKDATGAANYLRALFDEYQPQVDALVFDETHNPGGSVGFAGDIISLLAKGDYNDYVQQMHADRKWLASFQKIYTQVLPLDPEVAQIIMDQAHSIDVAYSSGKTLSPPIPFISLEGIGNADPAHWNKPAMVLTDELSVSCADLVPAVVKANKMATLFGQTTMAGGGNVETALITTNAQLELKVSRGLGQVFDPTGVYPEEAVIEDNGVKPDVEYSNTLSDFRAGYVGYIKAMNAALLNTIAAAPATEPGRPPVPPPAPPADPAPAPPNAGVK